MKTIKVILMALFLLIVCSSVASAGGEWDNYQNNHMHWGYTSEIAGGMEELPTSSVSIAVGVDSETPLWITNTDKYMISKVGNYINTYSAGGSIIQENLVYPKIPLTSTTYDGELYILNANSSHLLAYKINSSGYLTLNISAALDSAINNSAIACSNIDKKQCYFLNDSNDIGEWDITGTSITYYTAANTAVSNTLRYPAVSDTHNDGVDYVIFSTDEYGTRGVLNSYNTNTHAVDTIFDGDGSVTIKTDSFTCSNPMIYNLDGGGFEEIIVTCDWGLAGVNSNRGGVLSFFVFKIDGTAYTGFPKLTTNTGANSAARGIGQPAMCDLGYAHLAICSYSSNQGGIGGMTYSCVLENSSLVFDKKVLGVDIGAMAYTTTTCVDLDADGIDEILYGSSVLDSSGDIIMNFTGTFSAAEMLYNIIPVSVDGTANVAFVRNKVASTIIYSSSTAYNNTPPTLTDSYGRSYSNPVCNGSTVRFLAKKYDETAAQPSGTNYYNDIDTDLERLVADCHGNGTLTAGSSSLSAPYVECTYNSPETYYATVYIDDNYNVDDTSQSDTISVYVITGVDCNEDDVGIGEESLEGEAETGVITPTSTATATFLDAITGGDNNSKIFIGFMIWLIITGCVMMGVAKATSSGTAVLGIGALCGVALFVILTALGILPVWILILFFIGLILLVILKIGFSGASGGS